jgi:hypothetical protein
MATDDQSKGVGPYSEQCFIKDFMAFFSGIHGKDYSDYDPAVAVKNSLVSAPVNILKVDRLKLGASLSMSHKSNEGAVTFMSNLNSPNGQRLLENVPKELMSNLQPKVEVYKIFYKDKTDLNGIQVPFPFNNFQDPSEKKELKGTYPLGLPGHLAVGLKEFSFDYLGTNPAEIDYYIDVNMKLWFNSVDAMFHQYEIPAAIRPPKQQGEYAQKTISFADLITRPAWGADYSTKESADKSSSTHLAWDPKYFRIRIDISYSPPAPEFLDEACKELSALGTSPSEMKEELLEAIGSVKVSFFLNLLRHNFGFRSDVPSGPFELNINYNGAVESALYSPDANILRAKIDTSKIEKLKGGEGKEAWQGMERMADMVIDDLGLDPRDYDKTTFFRIENSGFQLPFSKRAPHSTYKVLRPREEVSGVLETEAGIDVGIWPESPLEQIKGKNPYGAKSFPILGKWPSETANKLDAFYVYKSWWNEFLVKNGLAADQIRTRMYSRILEELAAKKQCVGNNLIDRPSRIYSMYIPSEYILRWRKRSRDRLHTPEEKRRIDTAKEKGGSREEIEAARESRFNRVRSEGKDSVYSVRREILGLLFKQIRASRDEIQQHNQFPPGRQESGAGPLLVPGAPQDPTTHPTEIGWDENINNYVSVRLSENPDNYDEDRAEEALMPPPRAPRGTKASGKGHMTKITWFYFGDLIDSAIDILRDDEGTLHLDLWRAPEYDSNGQIDPSAGGGSLKVILGDVTYYDPVEGIKKTISLLDLPVSYELFREFWSEKVIKPMREKYSFQGFLRDVMTELVSASLTNRCALSGEPVVGIRTHIYQASVPKEAKRKIYAARPAGDFVTGVSSATRGADRAFRAQIYDTGITKNIAYNDPLLNPTPVDMSQLPPGFAALAATHEDTMNRRDCNDKHAQEIIYLCATTDKPLSLFSGGSTRTAKEEDIKNGVLYLEVGVDGTPVETISFNKQDLPWFLEAKGERTGIKDNPIELSEPYHCSFSIYGNTMIKPGMYIYIRLPHFGLPSQPRSNARRLGLGGYFFVTKTRNSLILRGNKFDWITDVNCVWNAYGAKDEDRPHHIVSY